MPEEELAAFICSHIFENTHPVLLVVHDKTGEWQLLCGGTHPAGEIPKVVGINHLFERDPTLLAIQDMPTGFEAERQSLGAPWKARPFQNG